jgi:hypothetical protein
VGLRRIAAKPIPTTSATEEGFLGIDDVMKKVCGRAGPGITYLSGALP